MKILVLGHKGMLGHMVVDYLNKQHTKIETIDYRWPTDEFKITIKNSNCDFLINCIGSIPQKNNLWNDYKSCNILLPIFIAENFRGKIIHPTTDCEFSGNLKIDQLYEKFNVKDALDDYGISKAYVSSILLNYKNTKQIRTSIIGPEIKSNFSLMSWFFSETTTVKGYINHYWNGITTLEWVKQSFNLINKFDECENIIQLGTKPISKFELLCKINDTYSCGKTIIPYETNVVNKCLKSMYQINDIDVQLKELKNYENN